MNKEAESNMGMMVKVTGVSPLAITRLHEAIETIKPGKAYQDRDGGCRVVDLARIVSCKLDESYGTYTVELKITVKRGRVMLFEHRDGDDGDGKTYFGAYFAPISVLTDLFLLLSAGQQIRIFPENETLVENEKEQ